MTRVGILRWALMAVVLAAATVGWAQPPSDQPLPVDQATCQTVIHAAVKALEEEYVFPEVAAKMATALRQHLESGSYADVKTGQALAGRLTQHLQEVSKDKHVRVNCSMRKLPPMPTGEGPSPEMKERMRLMNRKTNAGYRTAERLAGNVGYLALDGFADAEPAAEPAAAAMNFLANTDALIIDVRRNGGGSPHGVALLCSYLFDEMPVHLNSLYWRKGDRTEEFWTRKDVPGKRFVGKDVYVLTSGRTFSAAEEFAYNLQTRRRATVVGESTGGGAHPGGGRRLDDHFVLFVPTGRAINPITKTNWEGTGVKPDVPVAAELALDKAHELAVQKILANTNDEELRRHIRRELEQAKERAKGQAARTVP